MFVSFFLSICVFVGASNIHFGVLTLKNKHALTRDYYYYYLIRPPPWTGGQSSWLQIQSSSFDSQRYQIYEK
jgi:hypothetical protein